MESFGADKSRYWLSRPRASTSVEDVDRLDLIQVIERQKVWEDLGIMLICGLCDKLVGSHCYHCRDCPKFQICPKCASSPLHIIACAGYHWSHRFTHIQYRPIAAPLYDGSDLQLFQTFANVENLEEFYLYFPFLFHDIGEMDEYVSENRTAMVEANFRHGGSKADMNRQLLALPTDWFIRRFGGGGWERLHKTCMDVIINKRIPAAALTCQLNTLLDKLKLLRIAKEKKYGTGDIPPTDWARSSAGSIFGSGTRMSDIQRHITYTLPLQSGSELNKDIKTEALKDVLSSDASLPPWDFETSVLESSRFVHMFTDIFQIDTRKSDLQMHYWEQPDQFVHHFLLKPQWLSRITAHMEIFRACLKSEWRTLPCFPHPEEFFFLLARSGRLLDDDIALASARRLREIGEYERAICALRKLDLTDPTVAFELQRVFEDQGYLNKEEEWFAPIRKIERKILVQQELLEFSGTYLFDQVGISDLGWDPQQARYYYVKTRVGRLLLHLIQDYHRCFSKGEWEAAITRARNVWKTLLEGWLLSEQHEQHTMALVHLELYYHRIMLAAFRDHGINEIFTHAISRLEAMRRALLAGKFVSGAWDVLKLELDLQKIEIREQYLENEAAFSVNGYVHDHRIAIPLLQNFINHPNVLESPSSSIYQAQAMLMLAHICREEGKFTDAKQHATQAEAIFRNLNSSLGLIDVEIFHLRSQKLVEYHMIQSIYSRLESLKDVGRLRTLRKLNVQNDNKTNLEEPSHSWNFKTRITLYELAVEAGDSIDAYRWQLRHYPADSTSASFIANAEAALEANSGAQSTMIMAMATFNLAKGFQTLANHFDAALYALLHYGVVRSMRGAEIHQRAILLLLGTLKMGFASQPRSIQIIAISKIAKLWNGWLGREAPKRWQDGEPRADEIERYVEGACFLPCLAGLLEKEQICNVDVDEEVSAAIFGQLAKAFEMSECLSPYTYPIIVPRLSLALGEASKYACNRELACRAYEEGLRICHSGDLMSITTLRFEAGKALTELTSQDPEHWGHVLEAGRALLSQSAKGFLNHIMFEGALRQCCAAYTAILRSYVAEARSLKYFTERGTPSASLRIAETENDKLSKFKKSVERLFELKEPVSRVFYDVDYLLDMIREEIDLRSPFERFSNLGLLASSALAGEVFDLIFEYAYIFGSLHKALRKDSEHSFDLLWSFMQARKATVLQERIKMLQSADIIKAIHQDKKAWAMYREETDLIRDGKNSWNDFRLYRHRTDMRKIPQLNLLLDNRKAQGATFKSLEPLASTSKCGSEHGARSIILVDWAQYHDYYFICIYDISSGRMLHTELLSELQVWKAKAWREKYLKIDGQGEKIPFSNDGTSLSELYALIEPIHKHVKLGSLLVFSPSQDLNAFPLHAIPYRSADDDFPVIYYHPVVFCPSAAILSQVVMNSLKPTEEAFQATFYSRYGDYAKGANENAMAKGLGDIASQFGKASLRQVSLVTGKDVTKKSFDLVETSHLIHFHGHADGDRISQHLKLESTSLTLQDAFTIKIPPAIVLLIACSSAKQDILLNDNTLGLVTSFFAAGATTIVGTLWPIDAIDGIDFSKHFYEESFIKAAKSQADASSTSNENKKRLRRSTNNLIDLATAMQKAILAMRASEDELCMDDEEERQLAPRETWRWAGYIMQGSWVTLGFE